jgi:hypothetical protein
MKRAGKRQSNTTAGNFPAKTFTKQEIVLETPFSYRTIPILDYVFEAILEERYMRRLGNYITEQNIL